MAFSIWLAGSSRTLPLSRSASPLFSEVCLPNLTCGIGLEPKKPTMHIQNQIGETAHVIDYAIRDCKHDFRMPDDKQLAKIAERYNVSIEAFSDYEISGSREVMEALFCLEEASASISISLLQLGFLE